MTTPSPEALVPVEQVDRDAAAALEEYHGQQGWEETRAGLYDRDFNVQTFARHRRAALETATDQGEVERLREALEWYGEQARLCRLIHREGDAGRQALDADGGKRARAALQPKEQGNG